MQSCKQHSQGRLMMDMVMVELFSQTWQNANMVSCCTPRISCLNSYDYYVREYKRPDNNFATYFAADTARHSISEQSQASHSNKTTH